MEVNREKMDEVHEYSFEEGIKAAAERIKALFLAEERDIIVEINGSSVNVGKSELLKQLSAELYKDGIPTNFLNDATEEYYREIRKQDSELTPGHVEKKVYIVGTTMGKQHWSTKGYRDTRGKGELSIDLYIGIYRPDKPFTGSGMVPVADILIRNDKAKDKASL